MPPTWRATAAPPTPTHVPGRFSVSPRWFVQKDPVLYVQGLCVCLPDCGASSVERISAQTCFKNDDVFSPQLFSGVTTIQYR